jgi:hypothetical protein
LEDTDNDSNISEYDLNLQSEINNKLFIKTNNIFTNSSNTTTSEFELN